MTSFCKYKYEGPVFIKLSLLQFLQCNTAVKKECFNLKKKIVSPQI